MDVNTRVLLLLAVAAASQGSHIEILHPLAESVVRRQSVEIEIQISGLQVPLEGYGLVQVDGRTIRCARLCHSSGLHMYADRCLPSSDVRLAHQSIIVADDTLGEGVRTITALLVSPDGLNTIATPHNIQFQFARDFQPSRFLRPELLLLFPRDGQLLRLSEGGEMEVRVRLHSPVVGCVVIVSLDGEERGQRTLNSTSDLGREVDGIKVVELNVPVGEVEPGQHLLEAVLFSADAEGSGVLGDGAGESRLWFEVPSASDQGPGDEARTSPKAAKEVDWPALSDISIGILASAGPVTLARTLETLRRGGLLGELGQLLVFVQEQVDLCVHACVRAYVCVH